MSPTPSRKGTMLRQLIADLFITVDGHASGRDAPAFFGYAGPDLNAWIDEQVARPQVIVAISTNLRPRVLAEVAASEADANGSAMTGLPKVVVFSVAASTVHRGQHDACR